MQITDKDIQTFRERAKTELQSNGAVGRLAWDTIVNALCNEVEELRKNAALGNAAAIREALEDSNGLLREMGGEWRDAAEAQIEDNNAALAATPRNCDRYEDADAAVAAFRREMRPGNPNIDLYHVIDWLFAPAEGGDHA